MTKGREQGRIMRKVARKRGVKKARWSWRGDIISRGLVLLCVMALIASESLHSIVNCVSESTLDECKDGRKSLIIKGLLSFFSSPQSKDQQTMVGTEEEESNVTALGARQIPTSQGEQSLLQNQVFCSSQNHSS